MMRLGVGRGVGFSINMSSHSGLSRIFDLALGIKGDSKECRRDLESLPRDSPLARTAFSRSPSLFTRAGWRAGSRVSDGSSILLKPRYLRGSGGMLIFKVNF